MAFKDILSSGHIPSVVVNSVPTASAEFFRSWQFSTLHPMLEGKFVATFQDKALFILDPRNGAVVGVTMFRDQIKSVATSGGFLYVLSTRLVRIAVHHAYVTMEYEPKKLNSTVSTPCTSVGNSPMGSLEHLAAEAEYKRVNEPLTSVKHSEVSDKISPVPVCPEDSHASVPTLPVESANSCVKSTIVITPPESAWTTTNPKVILPESVIPHPESAVTIRLESTVTGSTLATLPVVTPPESTVTTFPESTVTTFPESTVTTFPESTVATHSKSTVTTHSESTMTTHLVPDSTGIILEPTSVAQPTESVVITHSEFAVCGNREEPDFVEEGVTEKSCKPFEQKEHRSSPDPGQGLNMESLQPMLGKLSNLLSLPSPTKPAQKVVLKTESESDQVKGSDSGKEQARRLRMTQAAGDDIIANNKSHRKKKKKTKGKKISSAASKLHQYPHC